MNKTEDQIKLQEAFDNFDISLLQKCIDAGYNMNAVTYPDDSYFTKALFCYGSEDWDNTKIPVKQVIEFLDFALKNGLDINHTFYDCGEVAGDAFDIVRYCYNDEVTEFLLQHGMNLNYMATKTMSFYDYISAHVFWDIRGSSDAKFSYERERLITYYGSKPAELLENKDTDEQKKLFNIILSLDIEKISKLTANQIIDNKLDSILINRGQFYYPQEWYKNSAEYQKKLIAVFDVIISKIGINKISNDILWQCIYQQLPDLLEFLLEKGANPNVNGFCESYSWVKSSAMYDLIEEGTYFTKDLFNRFLKDLLEHGAICQDLYTREVFDGRKLFCERK